MTLNEILTLIGVPTIIATAVVFVAQYIYNICSKRSKDQKLIKKALQAILRDRLLKDYKDFNNVGYVSIEEKQNYNNMYQSYHSLGKNGVMDTCYKKVMDLPEKSSKKEKQNEKEN